MRHSEEVFSFCLLHPSMPFWVARFLQPNVWDAETLERQYSTICQASKKGSFSTVYARPIDSLMTSENASFEQEKHFRYPFQSTLRNFISTWVKPVNKRKIVNNLFQGLQLSRFNFHTSFTMQTSPQPQLKIIHKRVIFLYEKSNPQMPGEFWRC